MPRRSARSKTKVDRMSPNNFRTSGRRVSRKKVVKQISSNSKNNKNYNKCIQPNIGFTTISNGKCEQNPNLFNNVTRRKCQKYNHK